MKLKLPRKLRRRSRRDFDPRIKIVPDYEFRKTARPPYNKLCDLTDWRRGKFVEYAVKLKDQTHFVHRKVWEFVNCLWGLEELGVVREDSVALSVGAGKETPLFYFANNIAKMVATDIYEGAFEKGEGPPEMLTNPEAFAPFPYRKDHLEVARMSGTDLQFEADSFDFIFSLCAIEHFGGHEEAAKSVREMYRVLKPGGVSCISTELILNNRRHGEYFRYDDFKQYILEAAPFKLAGTDTIDLRISRSLLEFPIDCFEEHRSYQEVSPVIVLQYSGYISNGIIVFLRK